MMKLILAVLLTLTGVSAGHSQPDSVVSGYLREHSQTPVDYVMSRAKSRRITIIGEAHWFHQDASLVVTLVPLLQKADIDLAVEMFPASEQSRVDELIASVKWNERRANEIMRAAAWPYQGYRDLLRAAWAANQGAVRKIKILALGPPQDWRSVLVPRGISYDEFMADLVANHTNQTRRRVVVYCGMHHAFTRYYQAELDNTGRTMAYMDRMGNILSRRFGERVFLIALHKPIWCGDPAEPSYCLPFAGRIDCAAAKIGRSAGFDVIGSPLADLRFEVADYYAFGHPALRFVDYTDGYVWTGSIESFRSVSIIPLSDYAPDQTVLAQVALSNPFNDEMNVSIQRLREIWNQETAASQDLMAKRKWKHLAGWQSRCKED